MERRTEQQQLCGKRRCRSVLAGGLDLGRFHIAGGGVSPLKTSTKPGLKSGLGGDRAWRIVAGPELTPTQLHCATVADGKIVNAAPTWTDSSWRRLEAASRAALAAHFDQLDATASNNCISCGRGDDLFDYQTAQGRWKTVCGACRTTSRVAVAPAVPADLIPDDLSIPDPLRRTVRP
jgi:hypothetical protein